MKFADPERSVVKRFQRLRQIGATSLRHLFRLALCWLRCAICEGAGGRRLTSCPDRISRGNAYRAPGVSVGERYPSLHQPIEVRSVNLRVPECANRVEPL